LPRTDHADLQGPGVLPPTPGWNGDAQAPSLGARLDEAALAMHLVGPVRLALVLFGGLTAALILSLPASVCWVAGGLAIEGWSWGATRAVSRGDPVDGRSRLNFAASYLGMVLWWVLLIGQFWAAGGIAGHASAAVILLALAGIAVLLFHNVPAVLMLVGSAPAVGALSVVALADGHGWMQLLPVWMSLLMAGIFCLGRALETPSLQQSNRRLNLSLHKFEVLAENVPDMIARLDLDGRYLYVSPASLAVMGYAPAELVGSLLEDLLQPSDRHIVGAVRERLMAAPAQSQVVTTLARHKDGRWLWMHTSIKLVHQDGVPIGVIGVSHDVTERMAADAALQAAMTEAESANRVKSEFLANISHEFRTPMNGVLGALHLLERETISPEGRILLLSAEECGRTLSQLLNDVLDFSRMAAGRLELSPQPMDLGEMVGAITGLLHGEAAAKGVDLQCEITVDSLWIEADAARLRQALFNLVGNAVKFTARGRVCVRLQVETDTHKDTHAAGARRRVRLEVEDTGIGISPEVQALLFEQFRQAEGGATRRFGGTGLGLPMTRALVLMMDGEIGFTSREGEGSTFWLTFDAPAADPVTAAPVEEGMLDGVNILLVEDNPTNRLVARTLLTRLGADVEDAEDGIEGLEAARRGAHDLILMDIQMPRMDGVEATRAIRRLPGAASQVPIIALTANVMSHQTAEYLAAGMNGVVAKPISPEALLSEIARLADPKDIQRVG
jgi:PAS domain S-box-containing protein